MSLLKNLAPNASVKIKEKDTIGGTRVVNSGLYNCIITLAYLMSAEGGAVGLVFNAKSDSNEDIKQTFWVSSGDKKGNKTTYTNKEGEEQYLPGYLQANSLTQLVLGKTIDQAVTETKIVNVYNKDAKAEVATKVEMLTELLNKPILLGVIKQTVDKNVKDDSGKYVPTGDTRDENEIDKFFRASDRKTNTEAMDENSTAVFVETWEANWKDKVKDKTSNKGGKAGAPAKAGSANTKPKSSLFEDE